MLKNFLKEVVGIVAGKQSEDIAELIYGPKHVNEFLIAKKLNLTINQTRNILYKIYDSGLASSTRKKDKKKGWYTYFWKIEVLKSLEFLKKATVKQIEQLNNQIKSRETKQFYSCERCNVEFKEESALLLNFTCNECGEIFTAKDNDKFIKELNKSLDKMKKKLELIDFELDKENEKIDKIRLKEIKKEEKEKAKKKEDKKKLRDLAKKSNPSPKKKPKKVLKKSKVSPKKKIKKTTKKSKNKK